MESVNILDKILNCVIDAESGRYKYIQILVKEKSNTDNNKVVVRGSAKFEYHKENFDYFVETEMSDKLSCKSIGGGRINVDHKNTNIFVYGYSKSYGRCNHELTCQIINETYPDYKTEWSNEGY